MIILFVLGFILGCSNFNLITANHNFGELLVAAVIWYEVHHNTKSSQKASAQKEKDKKRKFLGKVRGGFARAKVGQSTTDDVDVFNTIPVIYENDENVLNAWNALYNFLDNPENISKGGTDILYTNLIKEASKASDVSDKFAARLWMPIGLVKKSRFISKKKDN